MKDLNLRTLLIIVVIIGSLSVIYQNMYMQMILIAISILLIIAKNPSKKNLKKTFGRIKKIGELILTLMILQILFRHDGKELFSFWIIKITTGGLDYGITSSLRFFLILIVAGLLFDIPYSEYIMAFNAWKMPYELSFLVASVIYFIPIFSGELKKINEALLIRGVDLKKLSLKSKYNAYITITFPIIAKALYNVQNKAISLELRGFRLHKKRTSFYQNRLKTKDIIIQMLSVLIFFSILLMIH